MARNIKDLEEEIVFEPHHYGPCSEMVEQELENLEILGLIERNGGIRLTKRGKKAFSILVNRVNPNELEIIKEIKELLNDLSEYELLALIYFTYPKMTKESRVLDKILKNRMNLAISLYLKGKVSLSKAAEISGKPLTEFIQILKKRGIKIPLNY